MEKNNYNLNSQHSKKYFNDGQIILWKLEKLAQKIKNEKNIKKLASSFL